MKTHVADDIIVENGWRFAGVISLDDARTAAVRLNTLRKEHGDDSVYVDRLGGVYLCDVADLVREIREDIDNWNALAFVP